MNLLAVQRACHDSGLPDEKQLQNWVDAALTGIDRDTEIVIRIVDEQESAELNEQYRHISGPTNVLSFPFSAPAGIKMPLLGDLVVCSSRVQQEAAQQHKTLNDHWAHIIVHGVLHLLGYDHIDAQDADRMEAKEIKTLQQLHINNPYFVDEANDDE